MAATQTFSNSSLVVYTKKSPNHSGQRTHNIDTLTPHCMAGNLSVESCGSLFANSARQASSNYGIGSDGRKALYVDEKNRSWCTSSNENDQRAITVEIASGATHPYTITAAAEQALVDLFVDVCKRNNIKKVVWSTLKSDRVGHKNGANITVHRDYAAKACPGDYIYGRLGIIASKINAQLGAGGAAIIDPTSTNMKVGDVVKFTGNTHYPNAAAASGSACKPGKATITATAKGKAHPYHVIAVSGSGSTVYGWVNAADLQSLNGTTNTTTTTPGTGTAFKPYIVRVTTASLNIRKSPTTDSDITGSIKNKGMYTIIAESTGKGATKWGKLKSGVGWISLDYVSRM